MNTNVQAMACGNCGNGLFSMYHQPTKHGFVLLAECAKCKSTTRIEPEPAKLQLDWGEGADGILCKMAPATLESTLKTSPGSAG